MRHPQEMTFPQIPAVQCKTLIINFLVKATHPKTQVVDLVISLTTSSLHCTAGEVWAVNDRTTEWS